MSIGAAAWLGLLALPAILLLLYLLRRGRRRHPVSSERLWREVPAASATQRRPALSRLDPALILALAALICLALAAAAPWVGARRSKAVLAVVVDCSPSMGVADAAGGRRRIDVAAETARALFATHADSPARLLVLACGEERVVDSRFAGRGALAQALREPMLGSTDPRPPDLSRALAWLRGAGGARPYVISDFAGAAAKLLTAADVSPYTPVAVGGPATNVAVGSLALSRPAGAGGAAVAVARVINAGAAARSLSLAAVIDGETVRRETLRVAAGASRSWRVRFDPGTAEWLEVRSESADALPSDDRLRTRVPPPLTLELGALEEPSVELRAAFEALRGEATTTAAARGVQVLRAALPVERPPLWLFLAAPTPRRGAAGGAAVALDPVPDGGPAAAAFAGVAIDADVLPAPASPADGSPLVFAAGEAVITLHETPGSRGVWVGIPLEATDLAGGAGLPLALGALLDWLRQAPAPPVEGPGDGADVAATRPPGALEAEQLRRSLATPPVGLRGPLLWAAALLIVGEGLRRVRRGRARPAADGGASAERGLPRAAAGGSR